MNDNEKCSMCQKLHENVIDGREIDKAKSIIKDFITTFENYRFISCYEKGLLDRAYAFIGVINEN